MYTDDVKRMVDVSVKKVAYLERAPVGYLVLSVFAGVYLGFGITLIFCIGGPFASEGSAALKLVMGVSFGIALTLVIFAGSELFTGNNMIGVMGGLAGQVSWRQVGHLFFWSLVGNLLGSLVIAWLVVQSGILAPASSNLIQKVAAIKMQLPAWELFLRGVLCNWLVCLAVWTASRAVGDAAKMLLIFWCLFAFIGSGFEHSIATNPSSEWPYFSRTRPLFHGEDFSGTRRGSSWATWWAVGSSSARCTGWQALSAGNQRLKLSARHRP